VQEQTTCSLRGIHEIVSIFAVRCHQRNRYT